MTVVQKFVWLVKSNLFPFKLLTLYYRYLWLETNSPLNAKNAGSSSKVFEVSTNTLRSSTSKSIPIGAISATKECQLNQPFVVTWPIDMAWPKNSNVISAIWNLDISIIIKVICYESIVQLAVDWTFCNACRVHSAIPTSWPVSYPSGKSFEHWFNSDCCIQCSNRHSPIVWRFIM